MKCRFLKINSHLLNPMSFVFLGKLEFCEIPTVDGSQPGSGRTLLIHLYE